MQQQINYEQLAGALQQRVAQMAANYETQLAVAQVQLDTLQQRVQELEAQDAERNDVQDS